MMFCPYWKKECLRKDCSSFEFTEQVLFEDKDVAGYEAFKKEKTGSWWYAVDIPYCRSLQIEIPMDKTSE